MFRLFARGSTHRPLAFAPSAPAPAGVLSALPLSILHGSIPIMSTTAVARTEPQTPERPEPKRPRIGPKLRKVIDLMVFDGIAMDEAARIAGTSTRAIRKAFERRHVLAFQRTRREVLRASIAPGNIHRAVQIRDQDENKMAALGAIRLLEQMDDEAAAAPSRAQTPGVVIVIGDASLTAHKRVIDANPLIEHDHISQTDGKDEG